MGKKWMEDGDGNGNGEVGLYSGYIGDEGGK
jgi:hypothetical protein